MRILCWLGWHKWEWYIPNCENTVIGTQICKRCVTIRGKRVKHLTLQQRIKRKQRLYNLYSLIWGLVIVVFISLSLFYGGTS